jgi:hypothetical protein
MIFFAESASFSALPESDNFHDLAKRFELNARLGMDVFAEQTFPRIIGQVFVDRLSCRLRRFVVKFNVAQYAEMICSKDQTTITTLPITQSKHAVAFQNKYELPNIILNKYQFSYKYKYNYSLGNMIEFGVIRTYRSMITNY